MAPLSRCLSGSIIFALVVASCLAPHAVAGRQNTVAAPIRTQPEGRKQVLKFPNKKRFGHLNIGDAKDIEARGDITVPIGIPITFSVGWDAAHDLSPLRRLPPGSLTHINFRGLEITDDQLKNLEHLTGVVNINLSDTDVTDKGMESLSKISSLNVLNVRGTLVTDKCLAALKRLPVLTEITLSLTRTGDEGLKDLALMKNLILLNLTHTQITDRGMKYIAMSPTLTNVELSFNKLITDAGVEYFKNSKTLNELGIANTSITIDGIKKLKNVKTLRKVVYSRNNISAKDAHSISRLMPKVQMVEILMRRREKKDLFEPQHMFAPLH